MTEAGERRNFDAAANWFADLLTQVPADAWSSPGLGVWDVRALAGHTARALMTVDTYLDRPASAVAVSTPWEYYAQVSSASSSPEAVAERGRQAGEALGDDPSGFVRTLIRRIQTKLPNDDPIIETIAGGMALSRYLPTRTFELVVHGYDLAAALDITPAPLPEEALAEVLGVAGRIAISKGQGSDVLLALTGRASLPIGLSVV